MQKYSIILCFDFSGTMLKSGGLSFLQRKFASKVKGKKSYFGGGLPINNDKLEIISQCFKVKKSKISDIEVLKKGMTNHSFMFSVHGEKYIMRIPGEGTEKIINRQQEANVLALLKDKNICEEIVYIDPKNGFKITKFLKDAKTCDPYNPKETRQCMQKLRKFHNMGLKVEHEFDIFHNINFYEEMLNGKKSAYSDYKETKENIFRLRDFIDNFKCSYVLSHIDSVADNFLFAKDKTGKEQLYLIDWEYAAMQDPHVDIAMFCIYSMLDRKNIDRIIDEYFTEGCDKCTRVKIYCYIAACGLLWSNWCEYKRSLGIEFGEYSLRQYEYAKDYYQIAKEEIENLKECKNV